MPGVRSEVGSWVMVVPFNSVDGQPHKRLYQNTVLHWAALSKLTVTSLCSDGHYDMLHHNWSMDSICSIKCSLNDRHFSPSFYIMSYNVEWSEHSLSSKLTDRKSVQSFPFSVKYCVFKPIVCVLIYEISYFNGIPWSAWPLPLGLKGKAFVDGQCKLKLFSVIISHI